jgi:hypothetical protein
MAVKEEHRLKVFESMMLGRIFGPKRTEIVGGRSKLHNEELHKYSILMASSEGKTPYTNKREVVVADP